MNSTNINQQLNSQNNLEVKSDNSVDLTVLIVMLGIILGAQLMHTHNKNNYEFKPCINAE